MNSNLNNGFIHRIFNAFRHLFPFSPRQGARPALAFGSKRKNLLGRHLNLLLNKPIIQVSNVSIVSRQIFVSIVMLSACTSGSAIMTHQVFFDIPIGSSKNEVTTSVGEPYAIHKKEDGSLEYEYIERFKVGGRETEERHYFLLIKDGKVASKRVEQFSPPPYIWDSYEMQTTQEAHSSDNP
ncbi:MAG TPA: hypothetical protein VLE95_02990 [Chlamydiales bacterium]|nr:hypothetical protein [Chlamydiales bacterium]